MLSSLSHRSLQQQLASQAGESAILMPGVGLIRVLEGSALSGLLVAVALHFKTFRW